MAESAEATSSRSQLGALSTEPAAEEAVYTAEELIARERALELEAEEAIPFGLGACTYDLGYIRQPVYACRTCGNGGICAHCSLGCHAEHDLVELFHRRHFRCDCGTSSLARLKPGTEVPACSLRTPGRALPNEENRYTKNFEGEFCYCAKGKTYDPETEEETMYQCVVCEEWYHENCISLGVEQDAFDPENFDEFICSPCVLSHPVLQEYIASAGFATLVPRKTVCDPTVISAGLTVRRARSGSEEDDPDDLVAVGLSTPKRSNVPASSSDTVAAEADSGTKPDGETKPDGGTKPDGFNGPNTDPNAALPSQSASAPPPASAPQPTSVPPSDSAPKPHRLTSQSSSQACKNPGGGVLDLNYIKALQDATLSEDIAQKQRAPRVDLYMGPNFRDRICRCTRCLPNWSKLPFVLDKEESYSPPVSRAGSPAPSLGLPSQGTEPEGAHAALLQLATSLSGHSADHPADHPAAQRRGSYERALAALDMLPRAQLASTMEGYHRLRSALYDHLRPLAQRGEVVTEAHIRAFFDAQDFGRPSKRPRLQ